jgi:ankyrin repeat protein
MAIKRSREGENVGEVKQIRESVSMPELSMTRLDIALDDNEISPLDYVLSLYRSKGFNVGIRSSGSWDTFQPPTDEQIALYDMDVVTALRDQNIELLRTMHTSGRSLQCCNRFGESLIHMACRRGFLDVVSFMVEEADVSLSVRDDYGRTPMHDACWAPVPNFALMELLLQKAPEQLFLADVRGHTPFSYVRKHDWKEWKKFLSVHESILLPKDN